MSRRRILAILASAVIGGIGLLLLLAGPGDETARAIAGRVVSGPDDGPVEGARVSLLAIGEDGPVRRGSTGTAADGSFHLEAGPGLHLVAVRHAEHGRAVRPVPEADRGSLLVRLPAAGEADAPRSSPDLRPLAGRVVDGAGDPVAGALVRVGEAGGDGDVRAGTGRRETETDAAGTFRLEVPAGRPLELVAGGPDGGTVRRRLAPGREWVRLVLPASATIRGRVVAAGSGRPLRARVGALPEEDAQLLRRPAFWIRTETDAEGRYELEVPADGERDVAVIATPLPTEGTTPAGPVVGEVSVEPGAEARLDLEAPDSTRVRGRVVDDASGAPVAGARVEVRVIPFRETWTAETGPEGTFAVEGLPGGGLLAATVRAPDRPPHARGWPGSILRLEAGEPLDDLVIRLPATVVVPGRVVDGAGRGVAGASIAFRRAGADAGAEPVVTLESGEDGRFEAPLVHDRVYEVRARTPGRAPRWIRSLRAVEGASCHLVLTRGGTIRGEVVDGKGRRVPDVPVRADHAPAEEAAVPFEAGVRRVVADLDGRFRLDHLPPGRWVLQAERGRVAPAGTVPARVGDGEETRVVVPVERTGSVGGRIRLAGGGVPDEWTVTAWAGRGSPREETFADPEGRWTIQGLRPGTWEVRARASGLLPDEEHEVAVRRGERTEVELVLGGGATLRGTVRDAGSGEPVPGATVEGGRALPDPDAGPFQAETSTPTDEEGTFALGGLRPGQDYEVVVEAEGRSPWRTGVRAPADGRDPPPLDVRLGEGGVLEGRFLDEGGRPVPDLTVTVMREHEGPTALTDAEGRFRFTNLAPGEHTLVVYYLSEVRPDAPARHDRTVRIREGETTRVEMRAR